ncbi:hypothetical protein DOTSEDRAFT_38900 [Dothistroma septosporum NZE10]|uniref:Uncharacterized protein n=1 Tax=Dothistroma septosporum (strain NZE10 / CBS 128990) TaxID=675120 RepID=M2XGN2_DOTSN|nr:hypothetical protein DOTSEDRAFT_38900 [Dothistroma septosporum NZE10]
MSQLTPLRKPITTKRSIWPFISWAGRMHAVEPTHWRLDLWPASPSVPALTSVDLMRADVELEQRELCTTLSADCLSTASNWLTRTDSRPKAMLTTTSSMIKMRSKKELCSPSTTDFERKETLLISWSPYHIHLKFVGSVADECTVEAGLRSGIGDRAKDELGPGTVLSQQFACLVTSTSTPTHLYWKREVRTDKHKACSPAAIGNTVQQLVADRDTARLLPLMVLDVYGASSVQRPRILRTRLSHQHDIHA